MTVPDVQTGVISLISAVIGGAIVAVVSHLLTRQRETERRRTEKAIEYRIEAWRAIADQTGRVLDADAFEKALAETILFGDEREVQLVSKIMDEFVAKGTADTTELLKLLRRNIRDELGLTKTSIEFRWLRVNCIKDSFESEINVQQTDIIRSGPNVGASRSGDARP
jgi:hypothetical protein